MIYLDNSATSPIDIEVFEAMKPYLTNEYGNPSCKYYKLAVKASEAVEASRHKVARLINAKDKEIVFTAGATESTNMIIKGVADYQRYYECKGNHIITSEVEHKATINTCKFLNGEIYSNKDVIYSLRGTKKKVDRGYNVTFLNVNEYGQIEIDMLENAINDKTVLVSLIWANNEIGSLNDIEALSKIAHKQKVLFHTDATQVVGKIKIDVNKVDVDFLSLSAHKIYGPKGVGAAYIKANDYGLPPMSAIMHGGEQEEGLRAGTLAVHNIVGFGKAAEIMFNNMEKNIQHISNIEEIAHIMLKDITSVEVLGHPTQRVNGIISIIVNKAMFNNERFIKKISDKIAISTGSACTAGKPSHVLQAIGRQGDTNNILRISIGKDTTKADIATIIEAIRNEN